MSAVREEATTKANVTLPPCVLFIDPRSLPIFDGGNPLTALEFLRRFKQWMIPMTSMTAAMKAEYFASCLLPLSPAEEWYNSLPNLSRANYEDVTKSFEVRFTTPEPDTHRTNTEIQMILKAENTFDESVDHASSGPSAQTATPIQAVAAIREVSDDPNGPKEYSTRAPATSANKVVPAEAASAPAALLLTIFSIGIHLWPKVSRR